MGLEVWLGEEKEWLVTHSRAQLQRKHFDFLVYGHRHIPADIKLGPRSRYINLGDWIHYCTYAVFDGSDVQLKSYTGKENKIIRNW